MKTVTPEPSRWMRRIDRRKLAAYIFFAIIASLIVLRFQNVTDKANDAATEGKISSQHAEAAANDAKAAVAAVQQEIKDRSKANCESLNTSRKELKASFNDLINLAISAQKADPNETEQQRADREAATQFFLAQFNSKLDIGLPIVDCNTLANG